MKRVFAFLLVFCMILGCCVSAYAAVRPVITQQPQAAPTEPGGKMVVTIKAHSFDSLTWYFVDPATGEKTSARKISKTFKGLKVSKPNGQTMTLKKVPAELNGWSLYAHFYGNGYAVDSEMIVLQVGEGLAPTASVDVPAAAPAAGAYTVSATGLNLYKVDESGAPVGDPAASLTFEGTAALCVMAPEGQAITGLLINSLQFTPSAPVSSLTINGIVGETVIQGTTAPLEAAVPEAPAEPAPEVTPEPAPEVTPEPAPEVTPEPTPEATPEPAPEETPEPEDDSGLFSEAIVTPEPVNTPEPQAQENAVSITCENCRFSGGGFTFATSGFVPEGTEIVVISGSSGVLADGYSINGAAAVHKNESSFRLVVEQDTTISMTKR